MLEDMTQEKIMDAIMEGMAGEIVAVVIEFSLKGRRQVRTRFVITVGGFLKYITMACRGDRGRKGGGAGKGVGLSVGRFVGRY